MPMMVARLKTLLPLLLAAIFLIAQVQATVHGIGHLSSGVGVADHGLTSHGGACVDCAAYAQAGAAPVAVFAPTVLAVLSDVVPTTIARTPRPDASPTAYRSRAPPLGPMSLI
jgi:hypothetical protein